MDARWASPESLWGGRRAEWKARFNALSPRQRAAVSRAVFSGKTLDDPELAEMAAGFHLPRHPLGPFIFPVLLTAWFFAAVALGHYTMRRVATNSTALVLMWLVVAGFERRKRRGRKRNFAVAKAARND